MLAMTWLWLAARPVEFQIMNTVNFVAVDNLTLAFFGLGSPGVGELVVMGFAATLVLFCRFWPVDHQS